MKLTGNTIVITGGTSGIGQELVRRLVERGNRVVTCGRRKDRLEELTARHPGVAAYSSHRSISPPFLPGISPASPGRRS